MANTTERSLKTMPEKRPVHLDLFVDLGQPCFIRELESEISLQGVK